MSYKHPNQIHQDEHAIIGGIDGKKVFVIDDNGNQITNFGGNSLATVAILNPISIQSIPSIYGLIDIKSAIPSGANYIGLVSLASIQGNVGQSGTWTVQPGNTANSTAWKVDGSAVTQPVSGTFWQTTQPTAEVAPTTIYNGKKTVTTAGTRVTLASSQAVKSVTIKALVANTGTIYVGDTSVAASNGFALAAGDSVSLDIGNLTTVNLDSSVNGEGVTYIGVN